jgi:hypothetical protein
MTITVHRFCNLNDSTTFLSHAAKAEDSSPHDHWIRTPVCTKSVLRRAAEHMDGKISGSPFVSVATDVDALVEWGVSGGLMDIIYGVDHPEWQATHIVSFMVPDYSVVTVDRIVEGFPEAKMLVGVARSRQETEMLYYGNDIKRYMFQHKKNPYTKADFEEIVARRVAKAKEQEKLDDEEFERVEQARKTSLPNIQSAAVKDRFADFSKNRDWFLENHGDALMSANEKLARGFSGLRASSSPLQIGMVLRGLDAAISTEPALFGVAEAWLALTRPYRSKE